MCVSCAQGGGASGALGTFGSTPRLGYIDSARGPHGTERHAAEGGLAGGSAVERPVVVGAGASGFGCLPDQLPCRTQDSTLRGDPQAVPVRAVLGLLRGLQLVRAEDTERHATIEADAWGRRQAVVERGERARAGNGHFTSEEPQRVWMAI